MLGSVPPSVGGGVPATLSAITIAVAPAACAFRALMTNVQAPRSSSTMLPSTVPGLVSGSQPSLPAPAPSSPRTTVPLKLAGVIAGQKLAVPYSYSPARATGAVAVNAVRGSSGNPAPRGEIGRANV